MSNLAALYKKDLQISYIPSVSQVEFSRHSKAPQPTCRAVLRQRITSAGRDKHPIWVQRRDTGWGQLGAGTKFKGKGSEELILEACPEGHGTDPCEEEQGEKGDVQALLNF